MNLGDRLRRWFSAEGATVASEAGATPIRECALRKRVRIAGRISNPGTNPTTGWYEAQLVDATGSVTLLWMARDSITVLKEGSVVVASGRLALRGGAPVIYNPAFSVWPS